MPADWQTPLALLVVAIAAAGLLAPALRRLRSGAEAKGGCASGGEGCGCTAVKKNLRVK
jgi:hypothetical protein